MSKQIKKVKQCLADIAEQVDKNYEYVNFGGCAVYAVELAKRLQALGYTDYKLRVYGYKKANVSKAEKVVRQDNRGNTPPTDNFPWRCNDVTFCHVRLQWRGMMWDVKGAVPRKNGSDWNGYVLQRGSISFEAMTALLPKQSNWNRWFNRRKIPTIRRIMNKNFKAVA